MDDFLRRLFEMMNNKDFANNPDFGFGEFDVDFSSMFPDATVRRGVTISVTEGDDEGIRKAIKILRGLLSSAKVETDESADEENSTNGAKFEDEFQKEHE
jgi:hypothetical protein